MCQWDGWQQVSSNSWKGLLVCGAARSLQSLHLHGLWGQPDLALSLSSATAPHSCVTLNEGLQLSVSSSVRRDC